MLKKTRKDAIVEYLPGISGICMPSPSIVAFIVSEITAFIRTDGQRDKRTD